MIVSGLVLVAWVALPWVEPFRVGVGFLLIAAGLANVWRQVRWVPQRTLAEPLVAILHAGYAFIGIGFVLAGLSTLDGGQTLEAAGLHAWTTGAIGTMTLAIMTRATRGHTGHALTAPAATVALYVAVISSAVLRIGAALIPTQTEVC